MDRRMQRSGGHRSSRTGLVPAMMAAAVAMGVLAACTAPSGGGVDTGAASQDPPVAPNQGCPVMLVPEEGTLVTDLGTVELASVEAWLPECVADAPDTSEGTSKFEVTYTYTNTTDSPVVMTEWQAPLAPVLLYRGDRTIFQGPPTPDPYGEGEPGASRTYVEPHGSNADPAVLPTSVGFFDTSNGEIVGEVELRTP